MNNNGNMIINVNTINMKDCNMKMTMTMNDSIEEVEDNSEPFFIRNPDNVIRSISAVSNTSGSRIQIADDQSNSRWITTITGSVTNRVIINLAGTNLYITLPTGDDEFVTLEPLGSFDNELQYLDRRFITTNQVPFVLSRGGIYISTQTESVDVGSFLIYPKNGQTEYMAVFGKVPV